MADNFFREIARASRDLSRTVREGRRIADDFGRAVNVDPSKRDADRAGNQAKEQGSLESRDVTTVRRGAIRDDVRQGRVPAPNSDDDYLVGPGSRYEPEGREERGFFGSLFGDDDEPRVRQASRREAPDYAAIDTRAERRAHRVTRAEVASASVSGGRDPYDFDASRTSGTSKAMAQFLKDQGFSSDLTGYWNERNQRGLEAFREAHGLPAADPSRLTNADLAMIENIGASREAALAAAAPVRSRGAVTPAPEADAPVVLASAGRAPERGLGGLRTLSRGARGEEVEKMQENLRSLGFDLVADGIFGKNTQAAVIAFQEQAGIKVDGVAGPQTFAAIAQAMQAKSATAEVTPAAPAPVVAQLPGLQERTV